MIIYKCWQKEKNYEIKSWDGWFLFGIIPIYVRQKNIKSVKNFG